MSSGRPGAIRAGAKTPPSFLGRIGEKIFNASPEGGAPIVFELGS